jgi:PPOX class probable F420-dependent enzyme
MVSYAARPWDWARRRGDSETVRGEPVAKVRSNNPFPALEGHKNMNLTTFRKSGEPVVTPVWYVILDGKLYVRTGTGTGKAKRIRNNPRVLLAPATVRGKKVGPESEAKARILGPGEEELAGEALESLRRRYKTTPLVDHFVGREELAVLEIVPAGR